MEGVDTRSIDGELRTGDRIVLVAVCGEEDIFSMVVVPALLLDFSRIPNGKHMIYR